MSIKNENFKPVVKGVSYFLAHVPSMVRHGSKPSREILKDPSILAPILGHLQRFEQAVAYPPNQVFIGNLDPDELRKIPLPWYQHPMAQASRRGMYGEIMPEEEFYGMLKICDEFDLILLVEGFVREINLSLSEHPLFHKEDLKRLGKGVPSSQVLERIKKNHALPLYVQGDRLIGCIQPAHEEDSALVPEVLLENLSSRASGALALRHLTKRMGRPEEIDYLLGCGEEAVGDRYNRGGGSMSKAIGELCGCIRATGSDVKAFCCGPVHAMVVGAGLVSSGIFKNVVVVGGGSLPKLGMKFHGHLRHQMPILEDVLGALAIWISVDDGRSPVIRLGSIRSVQDQPNRQYFII